MKNYFIFLIASLSILIPIKNIHAQNVPLPSSLIVMGNKLILKGVSENKKPVLIAEYIPAVETFDNWTFMFATRLTLGKNPDPQASALALANVVTKRKASGDIYANSMVLKAPDGKSVAVDFLASTDQYLEHNIWRYFSTKKGLVSFQIARRNYKLPENGSTTDFIRSIEKQRTALLNEIMRKDLPVLTGE